MTDVNPVAVVGLAAIMPMAPDGDAFWANITGGRYCITEVTPDRWDSALYYSPDHSARDKTYSIIGGWVREFEWDPIRWRLPTPDGGRPDGRGPALGPLGGLAGAHGRRLAELVAR